MDLDLELMRRRQERNRDIAEVIFLGIAVAVVCVSDCARAQADAGAGLVVEGSALVTTDAGVVLLPSAVCLDDTASVRLGKELASRRAVEPVLREAPVATPVGVIVGVAVGVAVGAAAAAWGTFTLCRETALCR